MEVVPFSVHGLSEVKCLILARSRNYKLYLLNRARLLAGTCPFCEFDQGEIIAENDFWLAKLSPKPEDGAGIHVIIFSREHRPGIMGMKEGAGNALFSIAAEVYWMYDIDASGILTRDGDPVALAGTVDHSHWHIMVPNGTRRLETPIAKSAEDENAGRQRAAVYEQLFQGTLRPEDFSETQRALMTNKTPLDRLEGYVAPTI